MNYFLNTFTLKYTIKELPTRHFPTIPFNCLNAYAFLGNDSFEFYFVTFGQFHTKSTFISRILNLALVLWILQKKYWLFFLSTYCKNIVENLYHHTKQIAIHYRSRPAPSYILQES